MPASCAIPDGLFPHLLGDAAEWRPTRLGGGANNLVLLLEKNGKKHILKQYARTTDRDRYASEKIFYRWAAEEGLAQVPQALGWDDPSQTALFGFIEGRTAPDTAGLLETAQAAQFLLDLNHGRHRARRLPIPQAADTGDWATQLQRVSARVDKLRNLPPGIPLREELDAFLEEHLLPAWKRVSTRFQDTLSSNPDLALPLSADEEILSPSDFGFHNCRVGAGDQLSFFDFEYAGWDDPAKTAADFLRQPRHEVPLPLWAEFLKAVGELSPDPARFVRRTRILAPLHNFKWCCIFLNEFLPGHLARRKTATGKDPGTAEHLRTQISKARNHLETFESIPEETWPT